jgi:hypothetical protein
MALCLPPAARPELRCSGDRASSLPLSLQYFSPFPYACGPSCVAGEALDVVKRVLMVAHPVSVAIGGECTGGVLGYWSPCISLL